MYCDACGLKMEYKGGCDGGKDTKTISKRGLACLFPRWVKTSRYRRYYCKECGFYYYTQEKVILVKKKGS